MGRAHILRRAPRHDQIWEPFEHPVPVGDVLDRFAEILAGVEPGERIATAGAFALKSELQKGEFEDGHAH